MIAVKSILRTASNTLTTGITVATIACLLITEQTCALDSDDAPSDAATIMERIDACQTAINEVNHDIEQAQANYQKSMEAAAQAQDEVDEQEARIDEITELLGNLSVSLYKEGRSENPLLEIITARDFAELDRAIESMESIADEEVALVREAKDARMQLEQARKAHAARAAQAQRDERAAQEARSRAERLHDDLVAQAAKITASIADAEARRSAAEAVAEAAFDGETPLKNPCPNASVSSGFGFRDFDHSFHQGLDLAAPAGTPYHAAAPGTVIYATNDGGYNGGAGNWVVIAHGNGIVTKYMHSLRTLVQVGDIVRQGQHIGDVGETGAAFGAHLHFQVEVNGTPVDPEPLI